ncbi:MAG: prepilin-type N-terminal cleavage/methylation domain-containing protein [Thermodesulfobacteriota bacterium]
MITKQHGFTLIEMMIAMAITLLVLSGVYEVFTSQQKAYNIQDQVAEMQQNARVAMDMMTREIRMAGYIHESSDGDSNTDAPTSDVAGESFTGNGAEDIDENGTNAITIEADIDGNNQTDTVRYSLSGGNLVREIWTWNGTVWGASGGAQPIAENITSLIFTYDNAARSNIRLIQISITARTAREDSGYTHSVNNDGYRTRTLTANVRPRNL